MLDLSVLKTLIFRMRNCLVRQKEFLGTLPSKK